MAATDLFGTVTAFPVRRTRFSLRTFRVALDVPEGGIRARALSPAEADLVRSGQPIPCYDAKESRRRMQSDGAS